MLTFISCGCFTSYLADEILVSFWETPACSCSLHVDCIVLTLLSLDERYGQGLQEHSPTTLQIIKVVKEQMYLLLLFHA